jgi:hypothetical protein
VYVLILRGARVGSFQPIMSLEVFSMTVIGGLGSLLGAVLGVLTFRYLATVLSGELRVAVSGAGLLVVLYMLPGGFGQAVYALRDRYLRLVAARRSIHVPSLIADSLVPVAEEAAEPHLDESSLVEEPVRVGSPR